MIFSKTPPAVLAALFIGFTLTGTALACSTDGWNSTSGAVVVGQPFGATGGDSNGIARVEEFCAMRATDTGYVQTNTPSHSEASNRFYVWPNLTGAGNTPLLIGFSAENGTGELFRIGFDGNNFTFATTGGGNMSVAAPAGWSLIEYYWDSNEDMFSFWVNADATTDVPTGVIDGGAGPATLESVRLGLPNGLGGFTGGGANFDSFEMHNTTAIGPLLIGDANADASVNVFDYFAVQSEIGGIALGAGQPDCNLDGSVNVFDYFCIQIVIGGGG